MVKESKKMYIYIYIHYRKMWVRSINLSLLNLLELGQFREAKDLPSALSNKVIAIGIQ